MPRLCRTVIGIVLLGLLGCASWRVEGDVVPVEAAPRREVGKVKVGEPYYDFTLPLLEGGRLQLSSLVGTQAVLLQFWGIRCAPCLQEFELLETLHRKYGEQGLRVVGVNTDPLSAAQLREAMGARSLAPSYPVVLDEGYVASEHYTHWLVPVSVLISRDGIVRAVHIGYQRDLDETIEAEVVEVLER